MKNERDTANALAARLANEKAAEEAAKQQALQDKAEVEAQQEQLRKELKTGQDNLKKMKDDAEKIKIKLKALQKEFDTQNLLQEALKKALEKAKKNTGHSRNHVKYLTESLEALQKKDKAADASLKELEEKLAKAKTSEDLILLQESLKKTVQLSHDARQSLTKALAPAFPKVEEKLKNLVSRAQRLNKIQEQMESLKGAGRN